jgi:hypothetical protein
VGFNDRTEGVALVNELSMEVPVMSGVKSGGRQMRHFGLTLEEMHMRRRWKSSPHSMNTATITTSKPTKTAAKLTSM